MANITRVQHFRTSNTTVIPNQSELLEGEIAINLADRKLFTKLSTTVFELGSNLTNLEITGGLTANGNMGVAGDVLTSNGTVAYWAPSTGGLSNIVEDTTPQLGGDLDANNNVILLADGSFSAPSISFASDTDTGFYRSGVNQIGLSLGGSIHALFVSTQTRFFQDIWFPDGAATGPSLTFTNGTGNGLYNIDLQSFGAAANSNEIMVFNGVTSAVNHIAVNNATTGVGPTIIAAGDNSNIDLNIQAKGTGLINMLSDIELNGVGISANNDLGAAGEVLTSNGSAVYWSTGTPGPEGNTGPVGPQGPLGPKSITIALPTASEDMTFFYTSDGCTINEISTVMRNTGVSNVQFTIRHGATRDGVGTEVVTGGSDCTTNSAVDTITTFNNATVAANSFVWLETTGVSGSVQEFHVTLRFA